jgi:glycosyltransferase involved in cell wall biosynthesis
MTSGHDRLQSISAFFPAFNEEENIRHVIDSALSVLSEIADEYEVLIVLYEGSADRTGDIVREMMRSDPHVSLILQPRAERGYGMAMRMGYENARYDNVFYSDADRQFDLSELRKVFPLIRHVDLVVGYRRSRQDPIIRIFVAKVYNLMMRIVFGLEQRDVDCAFKLCRKRIFEKITLRCRTGLSDTELLVKARLAGYDIIEVGVDHFPRIAGGAYFEIGKGKLLNIPKPGVVLSILGEMVKLWKEVSPSLRRFREEQKKRLMRQP